MPNDVIEEQPDGTMVPLRDVFSPNMQLVIANLLGLFQGIRDIQRIKSETDNQDREGNGEIDA